MDKKTEMSEFKIKLCEKPEESLKQKISKASRKSKIYMSPWD